MTTPLQQLRPIYELIVDRARERPHAPAVVSSSGVQLTYGQLDDASRIVAAHLTSLGVKPEVPVALIMDRSIDWVVAMLAVWRAGGAYVSLDPSFPPKRLAYMIEDSGASIVLVSESVTGRRQSDQSAALLESKALSLTLEAARAAQPETVQAPTPNVHPDNLAYFIYTSGTTGNPKSVAVTHRTLATAIATDSKRYELTPTDRSSQMAPTAFDAAIVEVWTPLTVGASVIQVADELLRAPEELWQWLAQQQITFSYVPTALVEQMMAVPPPANLSLRVMQTAGDRLRRRPKGWQFKLYNEYGPTENTVGATFHEVSEEGEDVPSIGVALEHVRTHVLDENLKPVPVGVPGELYLSGGGVARGYVGQPALTAQRFVPSPFLASPGSRMYRTGDLVRWLPNGDLAFIGRVDHQVKVRGYRVELGEIEVVLANHPAIKQVVVDAREDAQGSKQLVAYCVADEEVESGWLRAYVRERLPDYMVPVMYVQLKELPLNASGKVDRSALPDPMKNASPARENAETTDAGENQLREVWAEVLEIDDLGRTDNFFELGGNSIRAIQVVAKCKERGIRFRIQDLFNHPTVAELAALIKELDAKRAKVETSGTTQSAAAAVVRLTTPIGRRADLTRAPLTFAREYRALLFREDFCNFDLIWRDVGLVGDLNISALEAALNDVIAHHEGLRAVLRGFDEGHLVQISRAPSEVPRLELPVLESEAEALRSLERPFDLDNGELPLRACLIRRGEREHALVIAFHHAFFDGLSLPPFWNDLERAYLARKDGSAPRLPPLPFQTPDVEAWQHALVLGPDGAKQIDYWRRKLENCPTALLPADMSRPEEGLAGALRSGPAGYVGATLSPDVALRLTDLGRKHKANLYGVLLSLVGKVLARRLGQREVCLHSVYSHRDRPGTERQLGVVLNSLLMRIDSGGAADVGKLISRTMSNVLEAFENSFAPLITTPQQVLRLGLKEPLAPRDSYRIGFNYMPQGQGASGSKFADLDVVASRIPADLKAGTMRFDYLFFISPQQDSISLGLAFKSNLFRQETAEALFSECVETLSSASP